MADRSGAPPQMVALGTIVNTHGIRGELRVLPYNPDTEALGSGAAVVLQRGARQRIAEVRAARRHKKFILITVGGVETSAAQELVGWEIAVPAASLPRPGDGEVYHFQLVGLAVVTTAGEEIGVVEEVLSTAASDICVVRRDGREFLVPFVEPIIRSVDLDGGRLVIEPLPGLLEE